MTNIELITLDQWLIWIDNVTKSNSQVSFNAHEEPKARAKVNTWSALNTKAWGHVNYTKHDSTQKYKRCVIQ